MKVFKIIVFLCIVAAILGCRENTPADEKTYKETVTPLSNLLDGYLSIKIGYAKSEIWTKQTKDYPIGQRIVYDSDDIRKREQYFYNKKEKWIKLDAALKGFHTKYPNSVWADDAAFYRAVEFMLAKYPYNFLKGFCVDSLERFLSEFKEFKIDDWTRKRVGNLYEILFEMEASDSESIQNAKIRGTFYTMLIVQHCLDKDFDGAEAALKLLEAEKSPVDRFTGNCRILIDLYKKEST